MIMGWGLQSKSKVKNIAGLGVPGGKNEGKVGTSEKAEKSPRAYKWGPERRDLHCLLPNLSQKAAPQHQWLPQDESPTDLHLLTTPLLRFMGTVHTTKCHWFSP